MSSCDFGQAGVFIISLFLIGKIKGELKPIPISPSSKGLILFCAGLLLHLISRCLMIDFVCGFFTYAGALRRKESISALMRVSARIENGKIDGTFGLQKNFIIS